MESYYLLHKLSNAQLPSSRHQGPPQRVGMACRMIVAVLPSDINHQAQAGYVDIISPIGISVSYTSVRYSI